MRNSNEISMDLDAKMKALENAAVEERQALAAEVNDLTNELNARNASEAAAKALAAQRVLSPSEEKDVRSFSIAKMLRQAAQGKLDGVEAEMNEEARKEMAASGRSLEGVGIPSFMLRAYSNNNASESGYGKEFVATTRWEYVEALRNALVASQAGVQYISGLQGNVSFVKGAAADASWYAEEAAAAVTKQGFSTATLSPKRLQIMAGYTYDLLKQSALPVESLIWNELTAAHAAALDKAIFCGSGSNGEPTGITSATGINTIAVGGAMTYANLVQMETECAADNAIMGHNAYVTNAALYGSLKTIPQVSGYPTYLMNNGQANGYDVLRTNGVATGDIIFGSFDQVVVGQWGGLDFVVDPFSSKGKGVIEVAAIAYHDVCVKRPEAFCVATGVTA